VTPAAARAAPGATASLVPFGALSAAYFAHIGFFNPYLPLWLSEMGLGLLAIGLLTSVQSATRLVAPYAWGALSDATGRRVPLMRWCALIALVGSAGLWWPPITASAWGIGAVLLVMFFHTSAMMPMSEAAMAHHVSHAGGFDAGRYGRMRLWGSLGFLLTVLAAGWWFEQRGMGSFAVWTSLSLLAVWAATWVLPHSASASLAGVASPPVPAGAPAADGAPGPATPTAPASIAAVLGQPGVGWFFASVFAHVLAHMAIYIYFSLYLDALGYSKATIGMLWAVSVVVEIAWFFTQGRWLPRLSLLAWLMVAGAVALARMLGTAAWPDVLAWLVLMQALHAVTFAAHHTVCVALVARWFGGALMGRGQALYSVIGYGAPGVLVGSLGGWLVQAQGLAAVFWAAAGAAALGTACAAMAWRRSRSVADQADAAAAG
jgi:MFS transporter, PPP family, 3-phenylpropionic acid transporter